MKILEQNWYVSGTYWKKLKFDYVPFFIHTLYPRYIACYILSFWRWNILGVPDSLLEHAHRGGQSGDLCEWTKQRLLRSNWMRSTLYDIKYRCCWCLQNYSIIQKYYTERGKTCRATYIFYQNKTENFDLIFDQQLLLNINYLFDIICSDSRVIFMWDIKQYTTKNVSIQERNSCISKNI